MANEIQFTILTEFDPDLVSYIKRSRARKRKDAHTGEPIPYGTPCYELRLRESNRLRSVYVTEATYHKLTGENEN